MKDKNGFLTLKEVKIIEKNNMHPYTNSILNDNSM